VQAESKLSEGKVVMEVELPEREQPKHCFLRARAPDGWRVTAAACSGEKLTVDEQGTADLTGRRGRALVEFSVERK
jgi:hypothetical protein